MEKTKSSEPREQICREDEKTLRDEKRQQGSEQGIRKDHRGQVQPVDKKRAQQNK